AEQGPQSRQANEKVTTPRGNWAATRLLDKNRFRRERRNKTRAALSHLTGHERSLSPRLRVPVPRALGTEVVLGSFRAWIAQAVARTSPSRCAMRNAHAMVIATAAALMP